VDQEQLRTVLPAVGGALLVVNGAARGLRGTLLRLHTAEYTCDVALEDGRTLTGVEYEDVCRLVD
jgi:DNA/RNA-binding protein KIN17